MKAFHPRIKARYALITHNSDFPAPVLSTQHDFSSTLDSPRLIAWFAQNPSTVHPKLHPLPQGFPINTKTFSTDWTPQLAFSAQKEFVRPQLHDRTKWLYVNFAKRQDKIRAKALEWAMDAKNSHFVTVVNSKLTQMEYVDGLKSHKFALCPPGNGVDTHRVYETLQHGAIPVVLGSAVLEKLHAHFPVLAVENFEEITIELLQTQHTALLRRLTAIWDSESHSPLSVEYWHRYIRSVVDKG